jgi:rRNA-processing protein FCF1
MLDTNTLDYIYDNKTHLVPKLTNLSKKYIHLYITHVQQDEINKMTDDYKKSCINKIISVIGIRRVFTSSAIIGIDEPSKHGFIGSNIGMYELVDDADLSILEKLQKYTVSNPMGNTADLIILYTAIKKKMHYLITDNTSDFEPMLKEMSVFIPNYLQLRKNCNLNYF